MISLQNNSNRSWLKGLLTAVAAFSLITTWAQTPILNSNPSITNKVIFLDFDGQVVSGTLWNNGATVNALPSTITAANKRIVWQRIVEDYRPFDVNVTTDSVRFNNANPTTRIRVVITPTSAWYGSAGGVAYLGSFTWGGTPGTPCWVFENQLSYNAKNIAEAAAHEVGHTLTLRHQSTYNASCVKTNEYHPGIGTGVTSWAPIMGVGYSKNVTIWHNGTNATNCTTIQNDHSNSGLGITSNGFLNFLPDDVGNQFGTAKILNLNTLNQADSGIVGTPTDVDAFRFTICGNRYVSVNARPWALDTVNYSGANLDIKLKLYNSSGTLLSADSSLNKLNALVGMNLTAGSYFFTIDGGPSANYSDYGSIGKYYLNIKATNPPALTNTISNLSTLCAGQTTTLNYTSNGTPNTWQWTVNGPLSSTYTTANPSLTFPSAGNYTISLLATGTSSTSCVVTRTFDIGSLPNLTIAGTNTVLCPLKTAQLSVSGASSYTWLPGNSSGSTQIVTPTINTTYTVLGSNGGCVNSAVSTLSVSQGFSLSINSVTNTICKGQSITLTSSGASNYTYIPGFTNVNPAVLSPTFNTTYTVVASDGVCTQSKTKLITVLQPVTLGLFLTDTLVCSGSSITVFCNGLTSYTLQPGNVIGNPLVFAPINSGIYTVSTTGNNTCLSDTLLNIFTQECNFVGLSSNAPVSTVKIYPNPAHAFVIIEQQAGESAIEIVNLLGELVYKGVLREPQTKISTANWPTGVYLLQIHKPLLGTETKKIIVE